MRSRTKVALLSLGIVAAMTMADGAALAHTFTASSSVSIRYGSGAFRGRVSSARQFCRARRTVTVFKRTPGPDRRIGSDLTDRRGLWAVRARARNGVFYAVASAKRSSSYGHNHRCRRATSGTIRRRAGTTVLGAGIERAGGDTTGPSEETEEAPTSVGAAGETEPVAEDGEGLPFSGQDALPWVVGGIGLVAMGSLVLAYKRRRRKPLRS